MPEKLNAEQCAELDITFPCNRMDNGEYRFRVMKGGNHGYGYILTMMPKDQPGEWQNSHHHEKAMETYIVQEGWIASARLLPDGFADIEVYRTGESFMTKPGEAHNVYMPSGAVIHTIKHGQLTGQKDWFASPELDELTKGLNEIQIWDRADKSMQASA